MTKEFVITYTDWSGRLDLFFCRADSVEGARAFAYWTLGDLVDIHCVDEA